MAAVSPFMAGTVPTAAAATTALADPRNPRRLTRDPLFPPMPSSSLAFLSNEFTS